MCVLAVGSIAAIAEAKPPMAATFHASSDSTCVTGTSNRDHIAIELWQIIFAPQYEQHLRDHVGDIHTHADHSYRACLDHAIKPGMVLSAIDEDTFDQVDWLIPTMSMRIDRVTDVVRGSIWAGVPSSDVEPSHVLTLRAYQCVIRIGGPCPRVLKRSITTDPTNHYRTDVTSAYDLHGGDQVTLTYRSTSAPSVGNTYRLERWTPFMSIQAGDKDIFSYINPKQTAWYRWRLGFIYDTVTATAQYSGLVVAAFSEIPQAGYEVSSNFASDATFVIPSTHTTVPIDSHNNQTIKTHCFPGLPLSINWEGGGAGYAVVTADSHGRASLPLKTYVAPHFHLAHGSIIRVSCISAAGDIVMHGIVVP